MLSVTVAYVRDTSRKLSGSKDHLNAGQAWLSRSAIFGGALTRLFSTDQWKFFTPGFGN